MQEDVGLMLGQIFFRVAGGFVGREYLPRFGVIDDLLLEYGNLAHAGFGALICADSSL